MGIVSGICALAFPMLSHAWPTYASAGLKLAVVERMPTARALRVEAPAFGLIVPMEARRLGAQAARTLWTLALRRRAAVEMGKPGQPLLILRCAGAELTPRLVMSWLLTSIEPAQAGICRFVGDRH